MGCFIIAEAGVNHNGDIKLAYEMIEKAKECGCDCIKFQTFHASLLVTKTAKMADYQAENLKTEDSQYNMLKKLEFDQDVFFRLKEHCQDVGIRFLSTPFDEGSVNLLEELGVDFYKMSSGDITNKPLLQYVAEKNKPIIISTGMCTMDEVREAVGWIEETGNRQIKILHCTSNYPTPYHEVNMKAMLTLREQFPYEVGYSDHTEGIIIPIMAAAMGAQIIEKHFTLDRTMPGPDHKASLEVNELSEMVQAIRNIESALGDGIKKPAASEENTKIAARKSIVLKQDAKKGKLLEKEDFIIKRPGTGIEPKHLEEVTGKTLKRDMAEDALLSWDDFE